MDKTSEERNKKFKEIANEFVYTYIDYSGYSEMLENSWKKQLHIYEIPFYYIEHAIAQLGALQVWRNYKKDKDDAIKCFKKALTLGSQKSLPELYEAANIKFDFSYDTISELMEFVQKELEKL
jgi:oligoendopeptidase F